MMDFQELKDYINPQPFNATHVSRTFSMPLVTDENEEDYKKWLEITEKLGIGAGKYNK